MQDFAFLYNLGLILGLPAAFYLKKNVTFTQETVGVMKFFSTFGSAELAGHSEIFK